MKSSVRKRTRILVVGLIFILICMGCSKIPIFTRDKQQTQVDTERKNNSHKREPIEHHSEIVYFTHTVKYHGETLSIIASWYTKDKMKFPQLAEVNPSIDPERMEIGNEIRIPENLLKTHYPMPKEYVDRFYPLETEEPEPEPLDDGTFLIGPK